MPVVHMARKRVVQKKQDKLVDSIEEPGPDSSPSAEGDLVDRIAEASTTETDGQAPSPSPDDAQEPPTEAEKGKNLVSSESHNHGYSNDDDDSDSEVDPLADDVLPPLLRRKRLRRDDQAATVTPPMYQVDLKKQDNKNQAEQEAHQIRIPRKTTKAKGKNLAGALATDAQATTVPDSSHSEKEIKAPQQSNVDSSENEDENNEKSDAFIHQEKHESSQVVETEISMEYPNSGMSVQDAIEYLPTLPRRRPNIIHEAP